MSADAVPWEVLSPWLDELLEASDSERAARLAELRTTEPQLAARLTKLLAREAVLDAEDFLMGQALGPGADSLRGVQIGNYTLDQPVGEGGMGTVWRARRCDGRYDAEVAVKLLNMGALGVAGSERFRREGQALARLAHPHIAHLIDAGVSREQPYLILEFVDGSAIDAWCDDRSLSVRERLALFEQVLQAVAHAHSRSILHRDLKPSNILVTGDGQTKLLDFGIAKLVDREGHAGVPTDVTVQANAFTPDYAAPEQVDRGEVTTATDVYALGVLLHVLLTGRHPTAQPDASRVERMRAVLEHEPAPMSKAVLADSRLSGLRSSTPAQLSRMLKGDLDTIVAKALRKRPAERYATVQAFAEDIRRHLNGEPISARSDSTAYRVGRFISRHRLVVGAAGAIFLTTVAGIVATTWQAIEARRERDQAIYQRKHAEFQARFTTQMLSEVGKDGQPLTLRQLLNAGLVLLEKNYSEDARFVTSMLINLSGRFMSIGDTNGEHAALLKAEAIARKSGDPELMARVQCNTVETELSLGQPARAQERMSDGLSRLAQLSEVPGDLQEACDLARMRLLWSQGDLQGSADLGRRLSTLMEQEGRTAGPSYTTAVSMLQVVLGQLGRYREALEWNRRQERAYEQTGQSGARSLNVLANRATWLFNGGDLKGSLEVLKPLTLELAKHDPGSADSLLAHKFGLLLVAVEESEDGLRWIERSLTAARANDNFADQVLVLFNRARARFMLGQIEQAEKDLAEEETLIRKAPMDQRFAARRASILRTQLLLARGNAAAALAIADQWLLDADYPRQRVGVGLPGMLESRALAKLARGDVESAADDARAALTASQAVAVDPERSADVGSAWLTLAKCQRAGHDIDGARASARLAVKVLRAALGNQHSRAKAATLFADNV